MYAFAHIPSQLAGIAMRYTRALVLVIVIVAIFFSLLRVIHSNTKPLVLHLILHVGKHNTHRQCRHRRTQRFCYVPFCCVFSFARVGYALWRCRRSTSNCLGYDAFVVPRLCLWFFRCCLLHSIPKWSFDGVSVPNGCLNDTDVIIDFSRIFVPSSIFVA